MSLFPEVDEHNKKASVKKKEKIQELIKNSEMYRPSNGTDGEIFESTFCQYCNKDNPNKNKFCKTLGALHCGYIEDVRTLGADNIFA